MEPLKINSIETITFTPEHLAAVLDGLSALPFRVADPVINSIIKQVKANHEQRTGSEPPAVGNNGDSGVNSKRPGRLRRNGAGSQDRPAD